MWNIKRRKRDLLRKANWKEEKRGVIAQHTQFQGKLWGQDARASPAPLRVGKQARWSYYLRPEASRRE